MGERLAVSSGILCLDGPECRVPEACTNPDIFAARSKIHAGTKRWDKVLLTLLFPSFLAIFPLAALDAGRWHWSSVPLWLIVLGYVLLSVGFFITAWAEGVNKFAEPGVRIQKERGQTVIDTGPYALVRHPMYLGACFCLPVFPWPWGRSGPWSRRPSRPWLS